MLTQNQGDVVGAVGAKPDPTAPAPPAEVLETADELMGVASPERLRSSSSASVPSSVGEQRRDHYGERAQQPAGDRRAGRVQ